MSHADDEFGFLRSEAALLHKLSREVPGAIYQYQRFPDGRTCFPFVSDAIVELYEVTPDELTRDASIIRSRLHPDDRIRVEQSVEESARTLSTWRCDYRVVLPQRGLRWLTGNARPERLSDGSTLWHGFLSDSTEQQLAREALRESEQRYRIQIEHAPEAVVVFDLETRRFVDANRLAEELFELAREELLLRNVLDLSPEIQPNGQPSADVAMRHLVRAASGEVPVFEWTHQSSTGRTFPTEVRLVALPFSGRMLVRGSISDISERKAALDALIRLESAINTSRNGVAMTDLAGALTYVNQAWLEMLGFSEPEDVLGRAAASLLPTKEDPDVIARTVQQHGAWNGEMTVTRTDGSQRALQINASLIRSSDGVPSGMLASITDVTEQRRLQAQLLQAQKLESVGRLAGGIAHDFNNLLTVMRGYLDLSLASLTQESVVRQDLFEVSNAADSAARLTQQLLAFSRKQIISPEVLDLNDVVTRTHSMLQRLLGEDIQLALITDPSLARVRFDPGQAEQVLVNLAINARDAMPRGGKLTIETSNVYLDAEFCAERPGMAEGAYVLLVVSDTGVGMSSDIQEHVFEPFFTTKEVGRGTGLGLAMIHGAVLQNGGRVVVYSEPDHGASFRIYLPAVHEAADFSRDIAPAEAPTGSETIMLVEDDAMVRALAVRLLERQRYRVLPFASGPEALAWLRENHTPVHLLLTDVIMPEMNGKELADLAVAMRPDMRVLFASGYTANVIVHHGVLKAGVEFLAKPFSMITLATRVREVLDRRDAIGSAIDSAATSAASNAGNGATNKPARD